MFYVYFGGESIFQFKGIHGNIYQFYLTTLNTVKSGNLIRPAGILDEPGALSFFVCFIAALRHKFGANKKITWILLIMGFITSSVAHLIYTTFHLLHEVKTDKKISKWIGKLIPILLLLLILSLTPGVNDVISKFLFDRFSAQNIDNLGMDRFNPFLNAIELIDIKTFLFGIHPDCGIFSDKCAEHEFGHYGYNPLTLLVGWGIFLSFPYYLSLIYLLYNAIRKHNYIFLAIFLLLLQRPYVMSFGYSMFILLTILVITGCFLMIQLEEFMKEKKNF